MKKSFIYLFYCVVFLGVLSACSFKKEGTPVVDELPKCLDHIVQSGDTLASIAKWYTGDADNWLKIASANPTIAERSMAVGVELCIPYEMVTNKEPFVRKGTNNVPKKITDPIRKEVANKSDQQKQISFDELKAEVREETVDAETATVRESLGFGQNTPPAEDEHYDNVKNDNIFDEYILNEPNQNDDELFDDDSDEDELSKARSELLREMLQDE